VCPCPPCQWPAMDAAATLNGPALEGGCGAQSVNLADPSGEECRAMGAGSKPGLGWPHQGGHLPTLGAVECHSGGYQQ